MGRGIFKWQNGGSRSRFVPLMHTFNTSDQISFHKEHLVYSVSLNVLDSLSVLSIHHSTILIFKTDSSEIMDQKKTN